MRMRDNGNKDYDNKNNDDDEGDNNDDNIKTRRTTRTRDEDALRDKDNEGS